MNSFANAFQYTSKCVDLFDLFDFEQNFASIKKKVVFFSFNN